MERNNSFLLTKKNIFYINDNSILFQTLNNKYNLKFLNYL